MRIAVPLTAWIRILRIKLIKLGSSFLTSTFSGTNNVLLYKKLNRRQINNDLLNNKFDQISYMLFYRNLKYFTMHGKFSHRQSEVSSKIIYSVITNADVIFMYIRVQNIKWFWTQIKWLSKLSSGNDRELYQINRRGTY